MTDDLIDQLATDLAAASYTHESVEALLGVSAHRALTAGVTVAARRALGERPATPLVTLTRLFLLGDPVDEVELAAAVDALGVAGLVALGLVARGGQTTYRAALSLNPVTVADDGAACDWWIVSDLDDHLRGGPARPDHVMGVGGATRSLIAQLPPLTDSPDVTSGRALDLGTGCGIVALHLARRYKRVVASDISDRALELGRANARLNGLADRIEFRAGSLFAPVAGEQFALIASNPPFVITPRREGETIYEYRDGGLAGDELAAEVVRAGATHLASHGTLVCLANWETPWGGNGLERVRGWLREAGVPGLAAWVVERDRLDPLGYAQMWARDGGERAGSAGYDERVADWLDDFEARRVVSIGLGSIRIARTQAEDPEPLVHLEQAAGAYTSEAPGRAIQEAFAAGIAAARMSDAELLELRWMRDAAVSEQREHEPGVESPRAISLDIDRPIARRVAADPLLAAAVGACDGELTMTQIADALATILEVDGAAAREALVASTRELAWLGMLAPHAPVDWSGDAND
ncbi:DUF7059 domain-containing protein [Leucobacter sp. HY1910]